MADDVGNIVPGSEPPSGKAEINDLQQQQGQQGRFMSRQKLFHATILRFRKPSAITARTMIAPWIARSQCGFTPAYVNAGPTHTSSNIPTKTPHNLPRPPETETPPTTA